MGKRDSDESICKLKYVEVMVLSLCSSVIFGFLTEMGKTFVESG